MVRKRKGRIEKTPNPRKDFCGAIDHLIGVFSAKEVRAARSAAKDALAVSTALATNRGPNSDTYVVNLEKRADDHSCAKATLSRGLAEIKDENAFREGVAHCVRLNKQCKKGMR